MGNTHGISILYINLTDAIFGHDSPKRVLIKLKGSVLGAAYLTEQEKLSPKK